MTKKALLCFVGNYQGYAEKLHAPAYEWALWKTLLSNPPYSFDSIVSLVDGGTLPYTQKATAANIRRELKILLTDASKDDQIVFMFGGHGGVTKSNTLRVAEQALFGYPDGDPNLEHAAIPGSKIKEILDATRPPVGTDVTFSLDCCYSGRDYPKTLRGNIEDESATGTVLAVPFKLDFDADWIDVRPFVSFAERETDYEKPVVLAACGPAERAHEGPYDGKQRLFFTARLYDRVRAKPDYTMAELIKAVNDVKVSSKQTAVYVGNKDRAERERFPGESPTPSLEEGKQQDAGVSTTMTPYSINARILGLASFVDARPQYAPPYQARVILPHDVGYWIDDPNDLHFACIEFPLYQILNISGPLAMEKDYVIGGIKYGRWRLTGHTISILNADTSKTFQRTLEFEQRVPRLTTLCRELEPEGPRPECFAAKPRYDLFSAFLNIPCGSVDVGQLQDEDTEFYRVEREKWTNVGPAVATLRTPRFVTVNVPLVMNEAEIVLEPYGSDRKDLIVRLKAGGTFLVANAREIDITGDGGEHPPNPVSRKQFMLNYDLSALVLDQPVLPESGSVPVDDCSVTDFP
jgi:hypothetical protein